MAKPPADQPLRSSLLDRLIRDPARTGPQRGQTIREIRESIRRDLEDLLNTRWRCVRPEEDLEELRHSLVDYGIPDFTGAGVASPESQDEFVRVIQKAIEDHEPRFRSVAVKLLRSPDPVDRTLRFRIDATIRAEPSPEPVVFDSSLEPLTGGFRVKEGGR
jgi:type VI secretion system protein ImpF